ncbi:polysaccharide deacetylase family protein [Streptomyces sp. NPDC050164]|uniref:polysaccharide deacetylase family protein n=1 Tax=Streptomyces sp. NPDC050164 TaxID=3365605 RepID=UPI0037B11E6A
MAQHKARATFFTVGQNGATHPDLTKPASRQVASRLNRTSAAIKAATGKTPSLFRPPYGAVNSVL